MAMGKIKSWSEEQGFGYIEHPEYGDLLPRLDVPSAYLALYEDPQPYEYPQPAPEWSRLMLAYNANPGPAEIRPVDGAFSRGSWFQRDCGCGRGNIALSSCRSAFANIRLALPCSR